MFPSWNSRPDSVHTLVKTQHRDMETDTHCSNQHQLKSKIIACFTLLFAPQLLCSNRNILTAASVSCYRQIQLKLYYNYTRIEVSWIIGLLICTKINIFVLIGFIIAYPDSMN